MVTIQLRIFFLVLAGLLFEGELTVFSQQQIKSEIDISDRLKLSRGNGAAGVVGKLPLFSSDRNTTFIASCEKPFSLFFGEKLLLSDVKIISLDIDSLNNALGFPNELTFFSGHSSLIRLTQVIKISPDPLTPEPRKKMAWMDFAIIGSGILAIFFAFIFPLLVRRMFGFIKLFSINFRDDRTEELRINSIPAILFYFFVLLFVSVILTLFLSRNSSAAENYFASWIGLVGLLLIITVLRYFSVMLMAWVYAMREVTNHQISSFFRLVFFLCLLAGGAMIIDFILKNKWAFTVPVITILIPVVVAAYYVTFYLRLRRWVSLRPLHLFSYLCVSEFIPLVLLVFTF